MGGCGFCAGVLVFVALAHVGYILVTRLGLGSTFPSTFYSSLFPLLDKEAVKVVIELETPPGNIAVSGFGRIFFTFHPEFGHDVKVAEVVEEYSDASGGTWRAFPDMAFQSKVISVLSLHVDSLNDRLWLLDFAAHGVKGSPQLVSICLRKNEEDYRYTFPSDVAGIGSMLNDFSISPDGQFLYIADTSIIAQSPGIIVFSVRSGLSYRVLSSTPELFGQSSFFSSGSHKLGFGVFGLKIHVDSIALSRDGQALYFSPLTGTALYCIETTDLQRAMCSLDEVECERVRNEISQKIHTVLMDKPVTDGISTDNDGGIWMTALEYSSIGRAFPVGTRTCLQNLSDKSEECDDAEREVCQPLALQNIIENNEILRWPDGLSFAKDGLYISNSALHVKFKGMSLLESSPYHIARIGPRDVNGIKLYTASSKEPSNMISGHLDEQAGQ